MAAPAPQLQWAGGAQQATPVGCLDDFLSGPPSAGPVEESRALTQYANALAAAGGWPDPRALTDEVLRPVVTKPFHRRRILKVHAPAFCQPRQQVAWWSYFMGVGVLLTPALGIFAVVQWAGMLECLADAGLW